MCTQTWETEIWCVRCSLQFICVDIWPNSWTPLDRHAEAIYTLTSPCSLRFSELVFCLSFSIFSLFTSTCCLASVRTEQFCVCLYVFQSGNVNHVYVEHSNTWKFRMTFRGLHCGLLWERNRWAKAAVVKLYRWYKSGKFWLRFQLCRLVSLALTVWFNSISSGFSSVTFSSWPVFKNCSIKAV